MILLPATEYFAGYPGTVVRIIFARQAADATKIPPLKLVQYDYQLRTGCQEEMRMLINIIYQFDVYISVVTVARARPFCYVRALPRYKNIIDIDGLFHSSLEKPVSNRYTYQLKTGITTDRHGMIIIENKGLIGLIRKGK
ncbi:hypothetical protein FHW36_104119 [Chitinophaga polysaccharea]|uniref:Uncharacterized protein n=1 Tax=Chitinophaga polysaccharea TaxID=1293035 RepID=A0A561PQP2_9BACT|nr:hypothetical protein [Chitinophaga polysaccharea]TWF40437.1 hypothetical protein FHW36_104119 [Chitinophaga polysaccharea]